MNNGWFNRCNNRGGHYALLLAVGAMVYLVNLGGPSLWDLDEGRNATAAFEMMSYGEWITPTFNSRLRIDKPVLLYWLQIFAYYLFGVSEFSARLPSALATLAALLVCYELGRRLFSASTGLIAGLILATSPMVCGAARFANPDALLNLFTLLTFAIFWGAYDTAQASTSARKRISVRGAIGIGAASGLAMLAKGPIGLLLPAAASFVFLLWNRQLRVVFNRRLLLIILVFVLVAAPWYVMVAVDSKGDWVEGFILKHNLQRFSSTMESHRGGPLYYPLVLLVGTAPWSVFLLSSVVCSFNLVFRPTRVADDSERARAAAYRFLWSWFLLVVVFFSLSATKLPNYILPMYAAAALLMGRFLDRWRQGTLALPRWHIPVSLAEIAIIGVVISAGLLIGGGVIELRALRGRHIDGLGDWALVGAAFVVGAAAAWWFHRQQKRTAAIGAIAVSAAITMTVLTGWCLAAVEGRKAVRFLVAQAGARQTDREIVVGCLNLEYLPSFNFYCQRDVRHCASEQEALTLLRDPQLPVFVFLPEQKWAVLATKIGTPCRVLGRCRDIYKNLEIVAVSNLR